MRWWDGDRGKEGCGGGRGKGGKRGVGDQGKKKNLTGIKMLITGY